MIYITAKYDGHGTLQIKIRDKGCGIADVEQAMQPLFTTGRGKNAQVLGFAVMESFMGQASRHFETGVWNHRHHAEEPCAACDEEWIGINRYRKTLA